MIGYEILAKSLVRYGVDTLFYLMGGPMVDCANACEASGMRMIDARHEQAAAMMATAYARLRRKPSVCMACSGPGVTNLVTGVANAWADGSPIIAIGGSAPVHSLGMLAFQETDQVALFKPITRWSDRCYDAQRIPEYVDKAFRIAFGSHPGPVYLDMPGDVLYADISEEKISWTEPLPQRLRPVGNRAAIRSALDTLAQAERPVLISGSGVLWSQAESALQNFVEKAGIPFWTTPQGRGVIPEDHRLSFLAARSVAFNECDLIVQVATRQSYVVSYARPPRWNANAKLIQIDIDAEEIGRNRQPTVGVVGDAKAVLEQLVEDGYGRLRPQRYAQWASHLESLNQERMIDAEARMSASGHPMHPLRLCKEIRDWIPRDAVLVVDGHEILTYARQSIPYYAPRSLNSGPYGCMGVGLPLGLGAKVALPDAPVVVLNGDGSFGLNAMEIDTAVRHNLPVICIISNNGGWSAGDRHKAGRDLGFTHYEQMFEPLGAFSRFVEEPDDVRPALEDALASGKPSIINVITDPMARATGTVFTRYVT